MLPKLHACADCGRLSPEAKLCRDCRELGQSRQTRHQGRIEMFKHAAGSSPDDEQPLLRGERSRGLKAVRR